MKQFSLSQDAAYLVPALRSRGSSFAWPATWRCKVGMLVVVVAAHFALLWVAVRMVVTTPPEALPMAETEVILEQVSADSPTPSPIPQQVKVHEQVQTPVPTVTPQQQPRIARDADVTEVIKHVAETKPTSVVEQAKSATIPAVPQVPATTPVAQSTAPAHVTAAAKPSNNAKGAGVAFNPKPPYPRILQEAGVGGTVGLSIQVNAEGRASSVSVVRSSGQPTLDASARDTVLNRWKFKAARSAAGDLVASTLVQSIRFVATD